jgi:6-phosphogluconolactonase
MSDEAIFYVGSYTEVLPHVHGRAAGIACYALDLATGAIALRGVTGGIVNPSFLAIDMPHRRLFAVQEVASFNGGGAVSSFAINQDWRLTPLGSQPTGGAHPCFVSIDRSGRWLLVANYSGGNVAVVPIGPDGALGPAATLVQHDGPHPHHDGPHPHAARLAPDERVLLVPDCGLDRVYAYAFDHATGALTPAASPWMQLAPGAGPRHLDMHPSGRVYVINERNSTLSACDYDAATGALRALQTLSTLPEGFAGANSCADIHVHPEGRFLYGSNRGHDSIAAFAIDPQAGTLTLIGHTPTGGRTPRNFAIDPSGTFLLAANQDSSSINTFRIERATGTLTRVQSAAVPSPVCVCFVS